jgi:hypothetical protein
MEGPANGVNYADQILLQTHGDYSGYNAPTIFSAPGARTLLQFKKYQILQASLLVRLANQMFRGGTAEDKKIGTAAMVYLLGHTAVLGGAMGMPMATFALWALRKMFGDSDEPVETEYQLRKLIGDDATADLLLSGVPAYLGLNLSGRLGMGTIMNPFGVNTAPENRDRGAAAQTLLSMFGPGASLLLRFLDGARLMGQGQFYKGAELMLPRGVSDVMKMARFSNEGVTTGQQGDVVLSPEDISFGAKVGQGLGLPTTDITERSWRASIAHTVEQFYADKAADIKGRYARASQDGNGDAMETAREHWRELQEARVENGLARQPMSDLLRVPLEQRKRERTIQGGVEYSKGARRLGQQLTEMSQ